MKKKILLTGNSGYIGTVMTKRLKDASYEVVGLDSRWFADNTLFPAAPSHDPDKEMPKDIRDAKISDLEGAYAVIHLAGLSNDPVGELNPGLTDEINCQATLKLAKFCKESGVRRFIFASSCSIYGKADSNKPIDENGTINPMTAYAKAKVDAEIGLGKLADKDFSPVFMRNATVYGLSPRLRLDLVVNNLLAWAYLTGEIAIMSDGTPWRPILHIQDFCSAFIAALEAPIDDIHGQVFNVGINEENYTVRNIAEAVNRALPQTKIKILNNTGSDERTYRVNFSKIKNNLKGFRPSWNLEKGIKELLDAYRQHGLNKEDFDSDKYFRLRTIKSLLGSGRINDNLTWTEAQK